MGEEIIKEQVLQFVGEYKTKNSEKLIFNSKPENKDYFYDYFLNNCTTIIKDHINESLVQFDYRNNYNLLSKDKNSYRSLIYENINKNSWGSLGIDICLGSYIDQRIDPEKNTFLPEYLFEYLNYSLLINSNIFNV